MSKLISLDDFSEAAYKLKIRGVKFFLTRFHPSERKRVATAWNAATQRRGINFWEIPAVQKRWNLLITGNAEKNYFEYLEEKYFNENTILLSPGCGTGSKEILLAGSKKVNRIDAFDIAGERIAEAKRKAETQKVSNINFFVSDISSFEPQAETYDVVLFDSFLHHVKDLKSVLQKIKRALKKDGLLAINEYVGANRFQWDEEQKRAADKALKLIPPKYKSREFDEKIKTKNFYPGLLRMILSDPSEAVNSENILNEIHKQFETVEEKPYGGNLLQIVLKYISHNFTSDDAETKTVLEKLFEQEDEFLKTHPSDFLFGVYRK